MWFRRKSSPFTPLSVVPQHVAIIMDGNGRWAKRRLQPRSFGHIAGLESVRATIRAAIHHRVQVLTLFAFGIDNWQRPSDEVDGLMQLFERTIEKELSELVQQGIMLRIIGDRSKLSPSLRNRIEQAEAQTSQGQVLRLNLAFNYSGQWDILQAVEKTVAYYKAAVDDAWNANTFEQHLSLHEMPKPDLFIRTSGEQRMSNFLLWDLAYTELYFTKLLWPDFHEDAFYAALLHYANCERRFGKISEQIG